MRQLRKLWQYRWLALVLITDVFQTGHAVYRSCITEFGSGFLRQQFNGRLWRKEQGKNLHGWPTYWESSGTWYLFRCPMNSAWMIGHKDSFDQMVNGNSCWLIAFSNAHDDLNTASEWWEWHYSWRSVGGVHSITCKKEETASVCKPAVMPVGPLYQWDWINRCSSSQNTPVIDFGQVGFGSSATRAMVLKNVHHSSMKFGVSLDKVGKDGGACFSWSQASFWNDALVSNENSINASNESMINSTDENSITDESTSSSADCHFAFHASMNAEQSTSLSLFTLSPGEQRTIFIDAKGNADGSVTGHSEAMAIFHALPAGELGPRLPFRHVILKASTIEARDFDVSPGTIMVLAAPRSRPGVTSVPQEVSLQLSANVSTYNGSTPFRVMVHDADHVRLTRDVSGGWVQIEENRYLLQGSKGADDESFAVLLPFDFPLNGEVYRWLHIHVDGLLSLGPCALPNAIVPRSRIPTEAAIVAVAWKDLVCGIKCTGIFLKKEEDKVLVTWGGVTEWGAESSKINRFQAEVLAAGEVVFRYKAEFVLSDAKMGILPMPSGSELLWSASRESIVSFVPWLRPQSHVVQAPTSFNIEVFAHEVVTRDGAVSPGELHAAHLVLDASPRGAKLKVPVHVVIAAGHSIEVEGVVANAGLPFKLVARGYFPFGQKAVAKLVISSTALAAGWNVACHEAQGLHLGNPGFASTDLMHWTNVTVPNAGAYRLCLAADGDFTGIYSHLVPGHIAIRGFSMLIGKTEVQSHAVVSVRGFVGIADDIGAIRLRILQIGIPGTVESCHEPSNVDTAFFPGGAWSANRTEFISSGLLSEAQRSAAESAGLREFELTWMLSGTAQAGIRQVCATLDGNSYVPVGLLPVDGMHMGQNARCVAGAKCSLRLQCRESGCSTVVGTVAAVALMPLGSECGTAEPVLYEASGNVSDYRVPVVQKSNDWVLETTWPVSAAGKWHVCFCQAHERSAICLANPALKACKWTDSGLCYWKEEFVSFLGELTVSGTNTGSPLPTTVSQSNIRQIGRHSIFKCRAGVGCVLGPFPGIGVSVRNRVRLISEDPSMAPQPALCNTSANALVVANGLSLPMVGQVPYRTPAFNPPFGGTWQVCYCLNDRSGCDNDLQEFEHQVASLTVSGLLPFQPPYPVPWCSSGQRCTLDLPGIDLSGDDYLDLISNFGVVVLPSELFLISESLLAVFEPPGLVGGRYSVRHCSKCQGNGNDGHRNAALVTYGELSVAGPFELGQSWQCFPRQDCDIGVIEGIVHQHDRLYLNNAPGSSCPPTNWRAEDVVESSNRTWHLSSGLWTICYCPRTMHVPCDTSEAFGAHLGVVIVGGVTDLLEGRSPAGSSQDLFFRAVAGSLGEWWSSEVLSVWTVEQGVPCANASSGSKSKLHVATMMKGKGAPDVLHVAGVDTGPVGLRTACVVFGTYASTAAFDFRTFSAKLNAENGRLIARKGDVIKFTVSGKQLPPSVRLQVNSLPGQAGDFSVDVCNGRPLADLGQRHAPVASEGVLQELSWGTTPATFPVGLSAVCLGWGSISSNFRGAWVVVGSIEVLFPEPSVSYISPSTVSVGNLLGCGMTRCVEQASENCHRCLLRVSGVHLTMGKSHGGPYVAISLGGPGRCGLFSTNEIVPLICDGLSGSADDSNNTTSENKSDALKDVVHELRENTCSAVLPANLLPGMHCVFVCLGNCQAQRSIDFVEVGTLRVTSGVAPLGQIHMMVGQAREIQVNLSNVTAPAAIHQFKELAHMRLAEDGRCTSTWTVLMPFNASINRDTKTGGAILHWRIKQDTPGVKTICLCMRGETCPEAIMEAWEVLGTIIVNASQTSSLGNPGDVGSTPDDSGTSRGSPTDRLPMLVKTFNASKHGPPFALRLLQNFSSPNTTEVVRKATEIIAECLQLPSSKVVVIDVLHGSIVIVFHVAVCDDQQGSEHMCDEKRALRWRWRQTLQDPNSALHVFFGDSIDPDFPAFLDANGCLQHKLSCGEWAQAGITADEDDLQSVMRNSNVTHDGSASPRSNSGGQRIGQMIKSWSMAFSASFGCILVSGLLARLVFRFVRRIRRRNQQMRQRKELQTELPKLQCVDVYADELPDDACPICLAEISDGEDLLLLPCNHLLHRECVFEWLEMHLQCPLCRCPLLFRECLVHKVLPAREGAQVAAQRAAEPSIDTSWWTLPSTLANRITVEVQTQTTGMDEEERLEQIQKLPMDMLKEVPSPSHTLSTVGLSPSASSLPSTGPSPSHTLSTIGLSPSASSAPSTGTGPRSPRPTMIGQPSILSPLFLPECTWEVQSIHSMLLPDGDVRNAQETSMEDQGEGALTGVLVERLPLELHDIPVDAAFHDICSDWPIIPDDLLGDSVAREENNSVNPTDELEGMVWSI